MIISVEIQRGNATSVVRAYPVTDDLENVFIGKKNLKKKIKTNILLS